MFDGRDSTKEFSEAIAIHGAREHNLKNLSLTVPRNRFVVVTGVSGSGKSTLAFDLLFAEGQRRFLDSMSLYSRQFVEQLSRPDVDLITGIPPTVSIEQRNSRGGGKSTVATVTEIFHFLRLLFARLGTAVAKYWVCKRGPGHAAEALECLGGNGYVEESGMPRVYRQQPLLSIWEGSGNVVCLDVLRALQREPETLEAFLDELEPAQRGEAEDAVSGAEEASARVVVERLAVALQASLLVRNAPAAVADAFLARNGSAYGTLPTGTEFGAIVARHRPVA